MRTGMATDPKITKATSKLNPYLCKLANYLKDRKLVLSTGKCTSTVLTPDSHEYNVAPKIKINGVLIPLNQYPKILGMTFDPMLKLHRHVNDTCTRAAKRNKINCALATSTWGMQKETLTVTYKAVSRSLIDYASQSWSPLLSESSQIKLQRVQNSALRKITGCTRRTHQDVLHQETLILPVRDHQSLIVYQQARRIQDDPSHVNNNLFIHAPAPKRRIMKQTLSALICFI